MKAAAFLFPLALLLAGTAGAQAPSSPPAAKSAAAETAAGEVKRIDKPAGKITLKHGEIKSQGMMAMTMTFAVKDKALLDKVAVGDSVRFTVTKAGSDLVVDSIEKAR